MELNHLHQSIIEIEGKFFKINGKRYYIKGVTYGTFAPDENGYLFPEESIVDFDFRKISENGINTVRTYTVPPPSILDIASKYGLRMMIGIPWEQHMTFLDSEQHIFEIQERVKNIVISSKNHPSIFCYAIGNEIPAQIVRWYGDKKVSEFLKLLYLTVKQSEPEALVTYVNYPTTEYLDLSFLDFYCFNVFLESKEKLVSYIPKLHNLSEDKPLVLSEIGLDSQRNGLEKQAEVLDWQIRLIFEKGCAGCFVFSWTDDWWRGGLPIEDWDFGLVDRNRNSKLALASVKSAFHEVPVPVKPNFPFISVIICTYNGSPTIKDTLNAVSELCYPNFEVLVINDGSKDNTAKIASKFNVRLISTENHGLSSARNTGLFAAKGEIIAYLDDDAYPDPQWLTYLASAYLSSTHSGIGGPNLPPQKAELISHAVANSPGGPCHVLINDEVAEHIPGCNMSFRKSVLEEIGGFDPIFTSAGDDVDICWRVQQRGYTIGFHHSALVWHHRRNSIRMYWKQQEGYGKAEALLEKKWPEKYNSMGHLAWNGLIYGNGLTIPIYKQKRKIFYGMQGTALFQSVYSAPQNFWNSISLMPELFFIILLFGVISLFGLELPIFGMAFPLFLASLILLIVQSAISAAVAVRRNRYIPPNQRLNSFFLTTLLHFLQPISRLKGRIKHGLSPSKGSLMNLKWISSFSMFPKQLNIWRENWLGLAECNELLEKKLLKNQTKVKVGGEFDRWDLEYKIGPFVSIRILSTVEEHGMGRQYFKFRQWINVPFPIVLMIFIFSVLVTLAWLYQAPISLFFFGGSLLLLVLKIIADSSYLFHSFRETVLSLIDDHSPPKLPEEKPLEEKSELKREFPESIQGFSLVDGS